MVGEGALRRTRPVRQATPSPAATMPRPRLGGPSPRRPAQPADTPSPRPAPNSPWCLRLPAQPLYARIARHLLQAALRSHGAPVHRVLDDAVLLASELVGNVVRHTGSPEFTLCVRCAGGRLRLEVGDCSGALPSLLPADPTAEGGRGLLLVDHLATRWGVDLLPHGKRTWCELAL